MLEGPGTDRASTVHRHRMAPCMIWITGHGGELTGLPAEDEGHQPVRDGGHAGEAPGSHEQQRAERDVIRG
ncbi:hypothetical protein THAOC_01994, partial [Thalassiosira oceanica]